MQAELTRTPRGRKPRGTVLQTESRGWLSIDEAADFIGASKPTVWALINRRLAQGQRLLLEVA